MTNALGMKETLKSESLIFSCELEYNTYKNPDISYQFLPTMELDEIKTSFSSQNWLSIPDFDRYNANWYPIRYKIRISMLTPKS